MGYFEFVFGWVVLLFQFCLLSANPSAAVYIESNLFHWKDSAPMFLPLFCTIIFASVTRRAILTGIVAFLSWVTFPVVLGFVYKNYVGVSSFIPLIGYGLLYALGGMLFSRLASKIKPRKHGGGRRGGFEEV